MNEMVMKDLIIAESSNHISALSNICIHINMGNYRFSKYQLQNLSNAAKVSLSDSERAQSFVVHIQG